MNRRKFLKKLAILGLSGNFPLRRPLFGRISNKKLLVLGIDGMDVPLTRRFMRQGIMPNLSRMVQMGSLCAMQSSMPPQSPVAWSNVIADAGCLKHGIHDFIHRDAATKRPYLSGDLRLKTRPSMVRLQWNIRYSTKDLTSFQQLCIHNSMASIGSDF